MIISDTDIREAVCAFVPDAPEGYAKMISDTVSELKAERRSAPARKAWKPLAAAAAVLAAITLSSAAVFGARPALAAEVPLVNGIVYAASPQRAVDESEREEIEALLKEALGAFAACRYHKANSCFRAGFMNSRDNFLAAAYVDRLLFFDDSLIDGVSAGELEISELQAERRAFRRTARATLELVLRDGTHAGTEECTVRIWENAAGMHIESIEFDSPAYTAFVQTYEAAFGAVPAGGASFEMIRLDNACLSLAELSDPRESARLRARRMSHLLLELDYVTAPSEEKALRSALIQAELDKAEADITPEVVSAEQTASRLMYLYWLGAKTGEVSDFSGVMERNEATDLFYWDALLKAEQIRLGALSPLVTVEEDSAEILEVLEDTEEILRARFHVQTEISDGISQGVGEEIVLTLRKDAGGFTVIGFDREVGDGFYTYSLKPAAARLKAAGYSWQNAGKLAYDALHEQVEKDAEWSAGN